MDNPKKFSQNNEQAVVQDLLAKAGILTGRLLDIGAYSPETFSNSRALIDSGWSGVLVEPSPDPFLSLLKAYQNNPEIILVNSAISTHGGWLDFYDSGGDAVSTSDLAHVARWTRDGGVKFTRFTLKSVSVTELFTKFGINFAFINLDVESLNWALFQAFPWDYLDQTLIVCVEHDGHFNEMTDLLTPYGFKKIDQNAENIILSRI